MANPRLPPAGAAAFADRIGGSHAEAVDRGLFTEEDTAWFARHEPRYRPRTAAASLGTTQVWVPVATCSIGRP